MADGFDIIAVGIEDEGPVIIGMIMRPEAGRAVVGAAGGKARCVEGVDQSARLDGEGDMGPLSNSFVVSKPEIGLAVGAETVGGAAD